MSQRAYVVAVISFCTTQETIRLLNGSNGRDNITGIISLNKHTLYNSKEVVMHYINEFLFDSARLLLFRDTVSEDTILNVTREYDRDASAQPLDLQFNADEMSMDTFALSSAGICLSFNCNLRCRYCGYSSEENDPNMLQFEDVKVFIRDIVRRRTIKKLITQKDDPLEIELTGGGEPTYNWELFCESIRFIKGLCKENRIPVQLRLTTNGMISENQADFVAANIDHTMDCRIYKAGTDSVLMKKPPTRKSSRQSADLRQTAHLWLFVRQSGRMTLTGSQICITMSVILSLQGRMLFGVFTRYCLRVEQLNTYSIRETLHANTSLRSAWG